MGGYTQGSMQILLGTWASSDLGIWQVLEPGFTTSLFYCLTPRTLGNWTSFSANQVVLSLPELGRRRGGMGYLSSQDKQKLS
jgi:hypothetical protein